MIRVQKMFAEICWASPTSMSCMKNLSTIHKRKKEEHNATNIEQLCNDLIVETDLYAPEQKIELRSTKK